MTNLEGRVAFITGGSSGIGLGIARACVEANMKVALGYRTKGNLDEAMGQLASAGTRVFPIRVDVTDRREMERAAADVVKTFCKVHILFNNAGVITTTPLDDTTYDDWDWVLSVNLTGVFNGVRAFLPHIRAHGEGGQIVTTASVVGLVANGRHGAYSTTKFAVVGMTEALRGELASENIGVSVFCPGFVKSHLGGAARNRTDQLYKLLDEREKQRLHAGEDSGAVMDPLEAGRMVVRGIRSNDLYILSHPEIEQGIRDRFEALLASLPSDLHPPQARVDAERKILRNAVYIEELDKRKRCS